MSNVTNHLFVLYLLYLLLVGKQSLNQPVLNEIAETVMREAPGPSRTSTPILRYGTIDCGLELMELAWPSMHHAWSAGSRRHPRRDTLKSYPGGRLPQRLLSKDPVDLLVVELGVRTLAYQAHRTTAVGKWEMLIHNAPSDRRPMVVFELWPGSACSWQSNGPFEKISRTRWHTLGYSSMCRSLNAEDLGGAIRQTRFVVVRILDTGRLDWGWPAPDTGPGRPMSNLLTPLGLLPYRSRQEYGWSRDRTQRPLPSWDTSPLPSRPDSWIETRDGRRRILDEEIGRGLGVPKSWKVDYARGNARDDLNHTSSVFLWEYLGRCLTSTSNARDNSVNAQMDPVFRIYDTTRVSAFAWAPPDLTEHGDWYRAAVRDLRTAAARYPDPSAVYTDGLQCLANHRRNYDATGSTPTTLQILWWRFPELHWDALRLGSRMNFRREPPRGLTPNSSMTPEQRRVAGAFVDELIGLGTLLPTAAFLANAPLFCVPKAGQPDEWRVIANMLTGGQNSVVANDPVFLHRPMDILEQMYRGGYSAVSDASKFFYQFRVHDDDRPYLGVIHPITGEPYVYGFLPMGGSNSPALAGRYGLAFLRLLKRRFDLFRGRPHFNSWWPAEFVECTETYNATLGHGLSFLTTDGTPAIKMWVHVDDFLIHGPTESATQRGLQLFLDLSVDVGLLCHPKKLVPPTQVVKYVGFEFDTRDIPTLRVPEDKRQRAQAMIAYVLDRPIDFSFSRLTLSVLAGVLESMAESTPKRLGHTYLRRLHELIHPAGSGPDIYYTFCLLSSRIQRDLTWWLALVQRPIHRQVRSRRSGVLVPTWGDGSGTGTGGTLGTPDAPLRMWMGTWSGYVFHHTSNWKELMTLGLTLRHLADLQRAGTTDVRGCSVFYFTDNEVTYWISQNSSAKNPRNQALIEDIRLLELELDVELHVVHVPGVVMIAQGTDGLSRGVWMTPLHPLQDQLSFTGRVFRGVTPDPWFLYYIAQYQNLPSTWDCPGWFSDWDGSHILHRRTIWFPPPEVVRQLLCFLLLTYVESPTDTSCLIILPRVMSHQWKGLSRCLWELATLYPADTPIGYQLLLPIPIVFLYIPPHVRCLTPAVPRLEPAPVSATVRAHRQAADLLRRL